MSGRPRPTARPILQADRICKAGQERDARHFEHLEHLRIPEEVPEVFARLVERELSSAARTNTQASIASEIVKRSGARPNVIVVGDDVPKAKPAPDMLLPACELLEVSPDEAWMIGDSRYDEEAAAAANVYFIGVGTASTARNA